MVRYGALPIRWKLLRGVAISALPPLVLSCVALLALERHAERSATAFLVPTAAICAGFILVVLLLMHRLQRVVAEELQSANDRAESASRATSELLAGMSHEMRTPLHSILSFAELGGQRAASLTPEKAERYYKLIEESGRRLLDLLNDAVDLADLEAGKRVLRFVSQPVEPVVRGVVDELRPHFQSRGIGLEATSCEATSGWIDRVGLMQVLRSVLTGAATSSGPGGTVAVALARSESGLLLSVTRRGSGVETRSPRLKLALCGAIMTAHGGRIWSEQGGSGETVYLEIPDRAAADRRSIHP